MDHCTELCTRDTTGTCALCEALAARDRFERFWFKGGWCIHGLQGLWQWWSPVPIAVVRSPDVVREGYKQYTDTLNKIMLTVLGVGLFCVLTVVGSPDQALLAPIGTIKIPLTDAPVSLLAFVIVVPFLLVVLISYLHLVFGYWLAYDQERRFWQHPVTGSPPPLMESLPMLFAFPDRVSGVLTGFIFYWFVPVVLATITWKAAARPEIGWYLLYVTGGVACVLTCLQSRRRASSLRRWGTPLSCSALAVLCGGMLLAACSPETFRRPFYLFRADLSNAWLVGMDMRGANLAYAQLQKAHLSGAQLQKAHLSGAQLQKAHLSGAQLQKANLQFAQLQEAHLSNAQLQEAHLRFAQLQEANLSLAQLQEANLQFAQLQKADLRFAQLQKADLRGVRLQEADLSGAQLQEAHLRGAQLQEADLSFARLLNADFSSAVFQEADLQFAQLLNADLRGAVFQEAERRGAQLQEVDLSFAQFLNADLRGARLLNADLRGVRLTQVKNLTQVQVNTACGDEGTKLPDYLEGLVKLAPCPE